MCERMCVRECESMCERMCVCVRQTDRQTSRQIYRQDERVRDPVLSSLKTEEGSTGHRRWCTWSPEARRVMKIGTFFKVLKRIFKIRVFHLQNHPRVRCLEQRTVTICLSRNGKGTLPSLNHDFEK